MIHFLVNYELSSLSSLQNFSAAGIAFNLILIRTAENRQSKEHPRHSHSALQNSNQTPFPLRSPRLEENDTATLVITEESISRRTQDSTEAHENNGQIWRPELVLNDDCHSAG